MVCQILRCGFCFKTSRRKQKKTSIQQKIQMCSNLNSARKKFHVQFRLEIMAGISKILLLLATLTTILGIGELAF
jgi:hypothetical protein